MEKDCSVVTLNGVEYTEVKRLEYKGNTYVILDNLDKVTDFCIKKLIKKDGSDFITGLESEEEFNEVLALVATEFKN